MAGARSGDKVLVKDLFTKGDFKSALNTQDYVGSTALIAATFNYRYEHEALGVARVLLENGADPNFKDSEGRSPLSATKAAKRKRIEKLLINAGSKP